MLVIEDDPAIRSSLVRSLTDRGYAVSSAPAGMVGLQNALDEQPDLVLLDLGLPDLDGHSLLTMLRAVRRTPVIVVTARDDDPSIVKALDAGADDYVVKPFGMDQLEARIRAVLRRTASDEPDEPITVGDLVVDASARHCTLAGRDLELSRREFDLLARLLRDAGRVVTRESLMDDVWDVNWFGSTKTLDVHVGWLRGKLGDDASAPRWVHTVRGVGFRFTGPAEWAS